MKNIDLASKYDSVYKEGASSFFSFDTVPETRLVLELIPNWRGLNVLEIGCGEGHLAAMMSSAGARKVDAVDFSKEAIDHAQKSISLENVSFILGDYREVDEGQYDVVVLQGVLEHLDHPFQELKNIIDQRLKPKGTLLTSSPSFINPRGYIWMALQTLFDVPMSLTDLHSLCPFDFEEFCEENNYDLVIRSTDHDWAAGERTIVDFKKRLTNALRDADMDNSKVDKFLDWLRKAVRYEQANDFNGATVACKIARK